MNLEIFQVDAFTDVVFKGNPAAVVPLENWIDDSLMQSIAAENNLSETVFFVPKMGRFHIRWFTPIAEVKLCGHATVAASHVLWNEKGYQGENIKFDSLSGPLEVTRENDLYTLNFPSSEVQELSKLPGLKAALGIDYIALYKGREDLLVVLQYQKEVERISPEFTALAKLDARGLIVSAPGEEVDFVSRCFYPKYGVDEDPVTGSAHTLLAPYWAGRLGKNKLIAKQLSVRGGKLRLHFEGERTKISGRAVTYLRGTISI